MNSRAMGPAAIHEFIFGDQLLHARFAMAIEILARIVIANPRPVTTAALAEALEQSPHTVCTLLHSLQHSGLLGRHDDSPDAWYCPSALGTITLADIFRCVSGSLPEYSSSRKKRSEPATDEPRSVAQQSVDLLLMQATMAINQLVMQHLQAFDLGRLKALGTPGSHRGFGPGVRSYTPEPI